MGCWWLGLPLQSNSSWSATAAAPERSTSTSARCCLFHSTSRKYSSLRCLQTCGFQKYLFSPLKSCTFSTHFRLELKYSSGLSTLLLFLVLLTLSAILKTFLQGMTCESEVACFVLCWSGKKHQAHYEKLLPNAISLKPTSTQEKAIPLQLLGNGIQKWCVMQIFFFKSYLLVKWNETDSKFQEAGGFWDYMHIKMVLKRLLP